MTNSIFIREDPETISPGASARVINCFYEEGHEYFYDCLDTSFFKPCTEDIYSELLSRLDKTKNLFFPGFRYQGVDLLSCFKLLLFGYAVDCAVAAQNLICFFTKNPDPVFYIEDGKRDWTTPYLNQIIEMCPQKIRERIRKFTHHPGRDVCGKKEKFIWPDLWPDQLRFISKSPTIAVYSDFQRAKSVVRLVRDNGCVYFADSHAPRMFINSLKEGFSYYQTSAPQKIDPSYHEIVGEFQKAIQHVAPFSDFKIAGLDCASVLALKSEQLAKDVLPSLLFQIDQILHFFCTNNSVRTVLLDEDITPTKNAFCQIAKRFDVTTFVQSHGTLAARQGFIPVTANAIFVWGQQQKKILVDWGCPEKQIIVSGCSRYHQYQVLEDRCIREKVFKQLGFNPDTRTVLFAPHPLQSERHFSASIIRKRIASILNVLLGFANIQVILKLHPGEKYQAYYEQLYKIATASRKVRIIKKKDPFLLIKASDFIIAHDSTIAVDGFALNRNVIFYSVLPLESQLKHSVSDFDKYAVFYQPSDESELRGVVELLIKDPSVRPPNARWEEARKECLNEEGGRLPEEIIASYLCGESEPFQELTHARE